MKNDGKCGICGDPWEGPRDHEASGKYATGVIVRHYKPGSKIHVIVDLTATHKGWFEFRICSNDDPTKAATHECLDQHVLDLANGSGSKYFITSPNPQKYQIPLKLPPHLKCSQCVLQWKYNAGIGLLFLNLIHLVMVLLSGGRYTPRNMTPLLIAFRE